MKALKILYEDKDILAIDKPSGIFVHADGKTKEKTVSDWFLKNYSKVKNVGESIFVDGKEIKKPGIVHRLDKETSGVLLLAKNQKAFEFLKAQFKNREIKKVYNAIVSGWVKNDRGVVNKPIGRSPVDFRRRLAGRGARGELREAITEYKVLKRFIVPASSKFLSLRPQAGPSGSKILKMPARFTFLEIKPKTGRTHQIRVHMKFLNHPVVCDSLYNPKGFCPKELNRLALHARFIEFNLPAQTGDLKSKVLKIESKLPKEIEKMVNPHT